MHGSYHSKLDENQVINYEVKIHYIDDVLDQRVTITNSKPLTTLDSVGDFIKQSLSDIDQDIEFDVNVNIRKWIQ